MEGRPMSQPRSRRVFLGAAMTGVGVVSGVGGAGIGSAVGAQRVRDALTPNDLRTRAPGAGTQYIATDFGVVGDGRADDAGPLNALLGAVERQGGGVVLLPHGSYRLTTALILRSGVQLTSAAPNHGYIAAADTASSALLVADPSFRDPFVVDTDDAGIVAGGMSGIDVRGTRSCGGVRVRKGSWAVVSKGHIDGCGEQGLVVGGGIACVFEDLLTTNCLLNRSQPRLTGTLDIDGTDHYLSRCELNASLTALSSSAKRVAALVLRGSNHFVSDVIGEYSDIGVVVASTYSRFSNVRADTNWGDGWVVSGAGNAFAACSSVGNSQAADAAHDGWVVRGGGNTFSACTVHTPENGTAVRYGFSDVVDNAVVTNRNSYVGCLVDFASSAPWSTAGYLGSAPVFAAHPVRPANGTQRPDASQTGLVVLFDYTSPTTITDFAGGVTGQTIRVIGNAAVTLAQGDRLRLRGRTDRRMAVDEVAVLTWYNGAWYESGA
jgi:hypothetical protein